MDVALPSEEEDIDSCLLEAEGVGVGQTDPMLSDVAEPGDASSILNSRWVKEKTFLKRSDQDLRVKTY